MAPNQDSYRSPSQARKRSRHPDTWKKTTAKKGHNLGQAYRSLATGKPVEKRRIGPPCKCKKKCFDAVGQENIKAIFTSFYESGSWDIQTSYIQKQVTERQPKRRRTDNVDTQKGPVQDPSR